ncbi:MAG: hypothetical protein Fur002_12140 [Anaerolineales bacterium]
MKKIFLLLALLLSACGNVATPAPAPTSTPTPQPLILPTVTAACVSSTPSQADIDRALSFTGQNLASADWERSYSVSDARVAVTWSNAAQGAAAYLEALLFVCGYEEPDLNAYFTEANWQTIFANYEDYQLISECRNDNGLRLYEFSAQSGGLEYAVSYWVRNDTDTRVIAFMLAYPKESRAAFSAYGAQMFPQLPNCS